MNIEWQENVTLSIFDDFDEENDEMDETPTPVSRGEIEEVDIISDEGKFVDMQFGNGSMAFQVDKSWYKEIV